VREKFDHKVNSRSRSQTKMERLPFVVTAIDGGQPWRKTYGDNVAYTDWQKDNFFRALKALTETAPGNVGFEFDTMPVAQLKKIDDFIPFIKKVRVHSKLIR
jgi:creatinase